MTFHVGFLIIAFCFFGFIIRVNIIFFIFERIERKQWRRLQREKRERKIEGKKGREEGGY